MLKESSQRSRMAYADVLGEAAGQAEMQLTAAQVRFQKASQDAIREAVTKANVEFGRSVSRNAQLPVPISHFSTVYGQHILLKIGVEAFSRIAPDPERGIRHHHDVEAFMREEITAAYELLAREENAQLWQHCSQNLARMIRTRNGPRSRTPEQRSLMTCVYWDRIAIPLLVHFPGPSSLRLRCSMSG